MPQNCHKLVKEAVPSCGKINQEVKPMCANADKTVHLKTLIAEIKALYAQWKKNRVPVKPTVLPTR